ncbi:integrating conjugative element protein [Yersinia kristensenii]|uniref:integrating conjugative element protein n=1 Tax=Yersinia kristensenii TaxID=28152 RepID=UPI0022FE2507|nr:integrating conjugative element protein [Yersinia kristensenii]MDA5490235.1 integrating conjugative element protein [Yersinia kristensenii]
MKLFFSALLMLSTMLLPLASEAALTIVGDLGGESTASYFDAFNAQPNAFTTPEKQPQFSPPITVSVALALPVHTPELSPGAVTARPLKLQGIPAVFIVGDDDLSRQWLSLRGEELKRLGAMGFVVNVAEVSRLHSLQALLPEIEMAPVSGSDLARRLQLRHYPLLITEQGLSQ